MNTTTLIRPAAQHAKRVTLAAGLRAPAAARSHVQAAIRDWDVPVDSSVAVLLTSELVTNAVTHDGGASIFLVITCPCGHLRVDVHDTSWALPAPADADRDAEAGRGLMLVNSLSSSWGYYRTPAGKAVYFTLAFDADP